MTPPVKTLNSESCKLKAPPYQQRLLPKELAQVLPRLLLLALSKQFEPLRVGLPCTHGRAMENRNLRLSQLKNSQPAARLQL